MYRQTRSNPFLSILALLVCFAGLFVSAYSVLLAYNNYQFAQLGAPLGEATDVSPFGINASIENDDPSTQQRKLELMRDAGLRWVRQPFPWREIEPAKRSFQWEKWDRLVDLYNQYGLEVVAHLDRPPAWSRQDNNWSNRPPDNLDDFGYFVNSFVTHFRGKVRYIQIWDEPNIFPNWGNQPVDPAGYAALLRIAYLSARSADPAVKVLAAGLAPNPEKGGRNMSDLLYLDEMYRHGAGSYFDIVSVKPYGLWYASDDRRVDDNVLNFSRVARHREISVRHGFAEKPVWAVEFGWNSLPEDWKGPPSIWGYVPEDTQADLTGQIYRRASREWPWLQVMLLQGMLPQHYQRDPLYGFSIVDSNLSPRPLYRAIKDMASAPFASAGQHGASSPFVSFTGAWRDDGATKVGAVGDSVEVRFTGTRLDLALWKTPGGGVAHVAVDGGSATNSPDLSGEGLLNLYGREPHQVSIVAAAGLADGEHTARLELLGPSGDGSPEAEVRLGGFVVRREMNEPWLPAVGAVWVIWTSAFLWAALCTALQLLGRLKRALISLRARNERLLDVLAAGGFALALALLYFGAGAAAVAIALIALAALAYYHLEMGLLFVAFLAPFFTRPRSFGSAEFSLVEIMIVACALAYALRWAVDSNTREGARIGLGPWHTNLPILLFVLLGLVSLTASTMLHESLRELRKIIVEPVVYYYLLVATLRGKRRALDLTHALILAGVAVSVIGLYQYAFTDDVITAEGVRRIKALYGSPNNVGLFLGRVFPLALCLAWFTHRHRKLYLVALSLMGVVLLLSFSLGAWIAVVLSLMFVAAIAGRRALTWTLAGAAAGGIALVPVLRLERIASHLNFQESTTVLRLHIWQAAVNMIRDNPVRGIGLDSFLYKYPNYMLPEAWREPNLSHPHNFILDFWLRVGSPGLIVFLWLLFNFFTAGARLYRRLDDSVSRALVVGIAASMVDLVLHGLIDNSYFVVDLAIIFWATLALLRILDREGDFA